MAVVFRAHDERLGRTIALKVLAPQWAKDADFRRRFIAESRAAAAVDDPHVIPVHEAGETDGVLFIAMRLVAGGDLRGVLAREGLLPPGRALDLLSPVASALDSAHAAGLVHRDVKPGNVLVDVRPGRPDHVYLSDFGLSKVVRSVTSLSVPGVYMGTPGYSSPEQIQGHPLDGRADQYSLACMTFELLTGQPPFERDQQVAVLLAHLNEPPPFLSARRPELSAATDAVLARALAKDPGQRYPSCQEFTEALRDALGLPPYASLTTRVAAGTRTVIPVSAPTASMWAHEPAPAGPAPDKGDGRRRRRLLGITLAVVVLMAAVVVPLTLTGSPGSKPPTTSASSKSPASATTPPRPTLIGTLADPGGTREYVSALAFAPDGSTLAVADRSLNGLPNGDIFLWNTHTKTRTAAFADPETGGVVSLGVDSLAFSPDGHTLAAGDANGANFMWNITTRKPAPLMVTQIPAGHVNAVAFAPDGHTFASAYDVAGSTTASIAVALWDTRTKARFATLTDANAGSSISMAYSPDGATLAVGDQNGDTYLWNVKIKKIIATFTDPGGQEVNTVAFSPDGGTLATGDKNGSVYLWSTTSDTHTGTFADPARAPVLSIAFAPHGTSLAVGDQSGSTYLWNTKTQTITAALPDPGTEGVGSVAFAPGGTVLAVGDYNGSTYLWGLTVAAGARPAAGPSAAAAGSATASATAAPPRLQAPAATLADPDLGPNRDDRGFVSSLAFAPGGTILAAADGDAPDGYLGNVYLWNTTTRRLTGTLTDPDTEGQGINAVAFEPHGTTLATADDDGNIDLWDTATRKLTTTLMEPAVEGTGVVGTLAFKPGSTILATGTTGFSFYLWNMTTQQAIGPFSGPSKSHAPSSLAFAPGGTTLAVGEDNGSTYLFNTTSWKIAATLADPGGQVVVSVAYAPNGTVLAAGDYNGNTYVWDTKTDTISATLPDPDGAPVESVAYAPDGSVLAEADENGIITLWNTATWKVIATLAAPGAQMVNSLAFAPGGAALAAGDENGTTYLWHIPVAG
jgi:serine/threonine-protein kinase